LEIEEKINKIKWCRRQNQAHFLLSANGEYGTIMVCAVTSSAKFLTSLDKTVKLWKVFEKQLKVVAEGNSEPMNGSFGLHLPKYAHQDTIVAAVPRKVYANGL
jgi:serine/threonine-protein phosphatase 2A regulatory subunit B